MWKKSHQVALNIYRATRTFPKDKARFYKMGRASAEELRQDLILSKAPGYLADASGLDDLLDEVCSMLHRLREGMFTGFPDAGR
ncbi:MAG TPA: four helix bundle protein [Planctomycetota bacterium]|nr:four helix bundle protein [Planctomycetota bacterium]